MFASVEGNTSNNIIYQIRGRGMRRMKTTDEASTKKTILFVIVKVNHFCCSFSQYSWELPFYFYLQTF